MASPVAVVDAATSTTTASKKRSSSETNDTERAQRRRLLVSEVASHTSVIPAIPVTLEESTQKVTMKEVSSRGNRFTVEAIQPNDDVSHFAWHAENLPLTSSTENHIYTLEELLRISEENEEAREKRRKKIIARSSKSDSTLSPL